LPRLEVRNWNGEEFGRRLREWLGKPPASGKSRSLGAAVTVAPRELPLTKDPGDVIHEAAALEAYLDRMLRAEGITSFEQYVAMFGQGMYRSRNQEILEMVRRLQPRRIFEFACAGGFLAELLLDGVDSIEEYVCSNFSTRMLDYTANQLRGRDKCRVLPVDADVVRSEDMRGQRVAGYDTFITTSFEHIRFDRELIGELPVGANLVFSVALFDDPEHFRVFENEAQLRSRYGDLLAIDTVRYNPEANKAVVAAKVRARS
jgi:hypothetical protein